MSQRQSGTIVLTTRDLRLAAAASGDVRQFAAAIALSEAMGQHAEVHAPRRVLAWLDKAMECPDLSMIGHQSFSEPLEPPMLADLAAVAPAAATETVLWTPSASAVPFTFFPVGTITKPGQSVKLRAFGVMTVPATAGTCTVTPRYGVSTAGVTLGASSAVAAGTISQTNVPWILQAYGKYRSLGVAATMVFSGTLETNGIARDAVFGGIVATIDTTTAQGLVISLTMSVASYSWTPRFIETEFVG